MKVSATLFEADTASGTCRNRPWITGGTGGRVSGSGEVVDMDIFRHLRRLSSCDSGGGITTKRLLFGRLDRYHGTANRIQ